MGKNKTTNFFRGKEAFQRMNFLFQASEFIMSHVNEPSLAAYYGSQMTSISKKSVLRMEPRVKRQLCKGCRAPLIPGVSSQLRINSSSKNIVITCLQCGTRRHFPMRSGYRVWVETPQASSETLSTSTKDQTGSIKHGKNQNQPKEQKEGEEIAVLLKSNETVNSNTKKKPTRNVDVQDNEQCKQKTEITDESNVNLSQDKVVCLNETSVAQVIALETILHQDIAQSED